MLVRIQYLEKGTLFSGLVSLFINTFSYFLFRVNVFELSRYVMKSTESSSLRLVLFSCRLVLGQNTKAFGRCALMWSSLLVLSKSSESYNLTRKNIPTLTLIFGTAVAEEIFQIGMHGRLHLECNEKYWQIFFSFLHLLVKELNDTSRFYSCFRKQNEEAE